MEILTYMKELKEIKEPRYCSHSRSVHNFCVWILLLSVAATTPFIPNFSSVTADEELLKVWFSTWNLPVSLRIPCNPTAPALITVSESPERVEFIIVAWSSLMQTARRPSAPPFSPPPSRDSPALIIFLSRLRLNLISLPPATIKQRGIGLR